MYTQKNYLMHIKDIVQKEDIYSQEQSQKLVLDLIQEKEIKEILLSNTDFKIQFFVSINDTNKNRFDLYTPLFKKKYLSEKERLIIMEALFICGHNNTFNFILSHNLFQETIRNNWDKIQENLKNSSKEFYHIFFKYNLYPKFATPEEDFLFIYQIKLKNYSLIQDFLHYNKRLHLNFLLGDKNNKQETVFSIFIDSYITNKVICGLFSDEKRKQQLLAELEDIKNYVIPFLQNNNYSFNLKNSTGETPLAEAIKYKETDIIKSLIDITDITNNMNYYTETMKKHCDDKTIETILEKYILEKNTNIKQKKDQNIL